MGDSTKGPEKQPANHTAEDEIWLAVLLELIEELGRDIQAGRVRPPGVIEIRRPSPTPTRTARAPRTTGPD